LPPKRRFTAHEKRIVAARQAWKCGRCEELLAASFEVDHVVPLHLGGEDNYETNASALCRGCHAQKTQREEVERIRQLQRLRRGRARRAPLVCTACQSILSPYFAHTCDP